MSREAFEAELTGLSMAYIAAQPGTEKELAARALEQKLTKAWQAAEAAAVRRIVEAIKMAPVQWSDGEHGKLPIDGRRTALDAIKQEFPQHF